MKDNPDRDEFIELWRGLEMSVPEMAEHFGVSVSVIYRRARDYQLPGRQLLRWADKVRTGKKDEQRNEAD